MTRPAFILASGSAIRAAILRAAGVEFTQNRPEVDEAALKSACALENLGVEETAMRLAQKKALAAHAGENSYVLGSDQILEYQTRAYDKPASIDEARARLEMLAGGEHSLVNAAAVARNGEIVWRHIERPRLFMRAMTVDEIDAYLAAAGKQALSSVGAYQVEGLGARLFERIDGDYFAVLGLSLFPLLAFLRRAGIVEY